MPTGLSTKWPEKPARTRLTAKTAPKPEPPKPPKLKPTPKAAPTKQWTASTNARVDHVPWVEQVVKAGAAAMQANNHASASAKLALRARAIAEKATSPVSYTHLTLPTKA